MKITSFDAQNGDAFLINTRCGANIIVDMGYPETYSKYMSKKIKEIINRGEFIDLLIITHFDSDHIAGAISFISDINRGLYKKSILKQVWHNSYRHLSMKTQVKGKSEDIKVLSAYLERLVQHNTGICGNEISALQGSTLASEVLKSGVMWNGSTPYEPIYSGHEDEIEKVKFKVLLPSDYNLKKLKRYWRSALLQLKYDFEFAEDEIFDDAFEIFMKNEGVSNTAVLISNDVVIPFKSLLEKGEMIKGQDDKSISNASSIVTVIEDEYNKLLLTGDASDNDLFEALNEQIQSGMNTSYDLVKISHHGSARNNYSWLKLIQSKYYLISTDGSKHDHPDIEVIVNIILSNPSNEKIICFNNDLEIINNINDEDLMRKYNFSVMRPNCEGGIEIEL